jgi:hypothetical protein
MDGYIIFICVLLSLAVLLSVSILILLCQIKFKDFSIVLKIQLITYDIIQEISAILISYYLPYTVSSFSFVDFCVLIPLIYARFIHGLLIFYISWVLFKLVVQKSAISNKHALVFALASNCASFLLCAVSLIISYYSQNIFLVYKIIYIVFLDVPSLLIEFVLVYYYFRIRKTLKDEYMQNNTVAKNNRKIAAQLLGYPLVFSLWNLCYVFYLLYFTAGFSNSVIGLGIGLFTFALYPILNSVAYGLSRSTKRLLFAMCLKDKSYESESELEENLRMHGLLEPRALVDLVND